MSGEAKEEGFQASHSMTTTSDPSCTASDPKEDTSAHPEVNVRVITTRIHSSTSNPTGVEHNSSSYYKEITSQSTVKGLEHGFELEKALICVKTRCSSTIQSHAEKAHEPFDKKIKLQIRPHTLTEQKNHNLLTIPPGYLSEENKENKDPEGRYPREPVSASEGTKATTEISPDENSPIERVATSIS